MSITYRITNLTTGERIPLVRDVCTTHPQWVHDQLGTSSESELQHVLDGLYPEVGGPDCAGVEVIDDCPLDAGLNATIQTDEGQVTLELELDTDGRWRWYNADGQSAHVSGKTIAEACERASESFSRLGIEFELDSDGCPLDDDEAVDLTKPL